MKKYALIVAGGSGLRAGGGIPKQFRMLAGMPVIWHSVEAFKKADPHTEIIIVSHPDWHSFIGEIILSLPDETKHECLITDGGESRIHSVMNGLGCIPPEESALVAIHDAARPLVSPEMISRGWLTASAAGSAIPVIPLSDSIREITRDGNRATDRARFRLVQTPQVFDFHSIKRVYDALDPRNIPASLTDDASVMELNGGEVELYDGIPQNIKITTPADFIIAEALLGNGQTELH